MARFSRLKWSWPPDSGTRDQTRDQMSVHEPHSPMVTNPPAPRLGRFSNQVQRKRSHVFQFQGDFSVIGRPAGYGHEPAEDNSRNGLQEDGMLQTPGIGL